MMHSSLEMHFALGASSNIDKTVPGSGLSNSYIDHAVLGTWTPGIKETINMVQTTDSSCKSGFLPIECSVPVKVPISRPSSARRSSLALCSSLNTALGFLTDYFGRVQLTQCRADLRACFQTLYTRQNIHSKNTSFIPNISLHLYLQCDRVQCMITQSIGCGEWLARHPALCRKCGLGSWGQADHNGVINMTLLCNQRSHSV